MAVWGRVNRFGPKLVNMYQDFGGVWARFLSGFNVLRGLGAGRGRLSESAIVR